MSVWVGRPPLYIVRRAVWFGINLNRGFDMLESDGGLMVVDCAEEVFH